MPFFRLTDDQEKMEAWAAEHDETPWSPWNSARGFIIMAPDEAAARHAASNRGQLFAEPWWLDPALTMQTG